jgi:hypothetical protein
MIPNLNFYPADEENYTAEQPGGSSFLAGIFQPTIKSIPIEPTIKPIPIQPTIKPIPIEPTIKPILIQPTIEPILICIKIFTVII